jgi:hypothetical protein
LTHIEDEYRVQRVVDLLHLARSDKYSDVQKARNSFKKLLLAVLPATYAAA